MMVVVFGDPLDAQIRSAVEKFRVVYSAIGSSQSPLWIAHEAELFRKHGLDVELLYVAGGSRAAQVILSGEVPVAMFDIAEKDPRARGARPEQFIDASLIRSWKRKVSSNGCGVNAGLMGSRYVKS